MDKKKRSPLKKGILACASFAAALGITALTALLGIDINDAPSSISIPPYSPVASSKEYTLMVYMVGSDLESIAGAATDNLNELKSLDTDNIHIVCEAGGSLRWQTKELTAQNNTRFIIDNKQIIVNEEAPAKNMGSASTLADFIAYSMGSYPADKYILALWNHGDGPVGGFGCDELFGNDSLTLTELSAALKAAESKNNPIDIIGFDACCMASVETAASVSEYASYMIASQEIEPSGGWDYTIMDKLSGLSAENAAKAIASAYYKKAINVFDGATVSVVALSGVEPIISIINRLSSALENVGYEAFSKARAEMSDNGGEGRANGESDLVDLISFIKAVNGIGAKTAQLHIPNLDTLLEKIDSAVIMAEGKSCGLSIYAPYSELSFAYERLNRYKKNKIFPQYESFSEGFAEYILSRQLEKENPPELQAGDNAIISAQSDENIKSVYMTLWEQDDTQESYYYMTGTDSSVSYDGEAYVYEIDEEQTFLGGQPLCTIELEGEKGIYTRFACPILLNDDRANLILHYDRENPYGKIMYAVMLSDKASFSKLIFPLFGGEKITPLYPIEAFGENETAAVNDYITKIEGFKLGESFVYSSEMQPEALPAAESALYGFWFTTYQNQEFFSEFFEAS